MQSKNPPRYAVTFEIPHPVREQCDRIAARLEAEYSIRRRSMPPHITIKAPFEAPRRGERAVRSVLDKISVSGVLRKIPVVLGDLNHFTHARRCSLYAPVESEDLHAAARYVINEFVSIGIPKGSYEGERMHITLARSVPPERFAKVERALKNLYVSSGGEILIETVLLYEKTDKVTKEIGRYPLK